MNDVAILLAVLVWLPALVVALFVVAGVRRRLREARESAGMRQALMQLADSHPTGEPFTSAESERLDEVLAHLPVSRYDGELRDLARRLGRESTPHVKGVESRRGGEAVSDNQKDDDLERTTRSSSMLSMAYRNMFLTHESLRQLALLRGAAVGKDVPWAEVARELTERNLISATTFELISSILQKIRHIEGSSSQKDRDILIHELYVLSESVSAELKRLVEVEQRRVSETLLERSPSKVGVEHE